MKHFVRILGYMLVVASPLYSASSLYKSLENPEHIVSPDDFMDNNVTKQHSTTAHEQMSTKHNASSEKQNDYFYHDNAEIDAILTQTFHASSLSDEELQSVLHQNAHTLQTLIIPAILKSLHSDTPTPAVQEYTQKLQTVMTDITRMQEQQRHTITIASQYQNNMVLFVQATYEFAQQAQHIPVSFQSLSPELVDHLQIMYITTQDSFHILDSHLNVPQKAQELAAQFQEFTQHIQSLQKAIDTSTFFSSLLHGGYIEKIKSIWQEFAQTTQTEGANVATASIQAATHTALVTAMFIIRLIAYIIPPIIAAIYAAVNSSHAAGIHLSSSTFEKLHQIAQENKSTNNPSLDQFTHIRNDSSLGDQTPGEQQELQYAQLFHDNPAISQALQTLNIQHPTTQETLQHLDRYMHTVATEFIPQLQHEIQEHANTNPACTLLNKQLSSIAQDIIRLHDAYSSKNIVQPTQYCNTILALVEAVHLFATTQNSGIPDQTAHQLLLTYTNVEEMSRLMSKDTLFMTQQKWQEISTHIQNSLQDAQNLEQAINASSFMNKVFGQSGIFDKLTTIWQDTKTTLQDPTASHTSTGLIAGAATIGVIVAYVLKWTLVSLPYMLGIAVSVGIKSIHTSSKRVPSSDLQDLAKQSRQAINTRGQVQVQFNRSERQETLHTTDTNDEDETQVYLENRHTAYDGSIDKPSKQSVVSWQNNWGNFEQSLGI